MVTPSGHALRPSSAPVSEIIERLGLTRGILDRQVALVTGGSRGIGAQAAKGLAHLGAHVIIADILPQGLDVATAIRKAGGQSDFIAIDIAFARNIDRLLDHVQSVGPIDILVNNAAQAAVRSLLETSLDDWDYTVETNLRAPFALIQKILPSMLERRTGIITNILAPSGLAFGSPMSASKAGLRSLTVSLSEELPNDSGVSVFGFAPGFVATEVVFDIAAQYAERLDISLEDYLLKQRHNPGYPGLMPPEHCGASLVHAVVHAKQYHGLMTDPYGPLAKAKIIDISQEPEPETSDFPKNVARVQEFMTEIRRLNHIIERTVERRTQTLEDEKAQSQALASVGMLAAGVAHEINNPLAYIIANLEQLAEALEHDPAHRELVLEARTGAEHIRSIVTDIKLFSRMDSENKNEVIDLTRVIDATLRLVQNEVKHRAQLVRQYRDPPRVVANESRIAQVLVNLLVNAAQSIAPGNASINEIRIVARADDSKNAVIEIHDTGCGIPTQDLEQVFNPFYTTKEVGSGTGLGLSICKNIIEQLGGTIQVESQRGEGTTAYLTLPATQGPASIPTRIDSQMTIDTIKSARVLVIDDDPLIAAVLQRALRKHQVSLATSGQQGLDMLLQGQEYDIVFCDLMMPNLTGMELHEQLMKIKPEVTQRIVFMTGGVFTDHAADFLAGPTIRSVEKPFDMDAIRRMVHASLEPQSTTNAH